MKRIGIIGNGVAATTAVREIRNSDQTIAVDVFTDERHPYYPRPNLIDLVAGRRSIEETIRFDTDWYEKQEVTLFVSKPVVEVDTASKRVVTTSTTHPGYDSILIGVGCVPFVPPFRGLWKRNVHVLRTLDDALDIRECVAGAGREIVIGGGILGIELAAAVKEVGGDPIIVSNENTLLPLQLDADGSNLLVELLERKGLTVLRGFSCQRITGDESVTGIVSSTGDKIEGDLVVIATGVRSNTQLAKNSGIVTDRAIVVNDHMETSAKGIFAAGDCAEWNDTWYGIIPWATATARVAAQNMLNPGSAVFDGITPSNTLQVAGIDLTSIGVIHPESPEYESLVALDKDAGTYFKAVLKEGKVVGGISLGERKVAMKLRTLIMKGVDVSGDKSSVFELD
ncbi:MAG: NAD(P)/FAD-dependent oxidoreductase [Candidatus Thorarchaeota archaeon]